MTYSEKKSFFGANAVVLCFQVAALLSVIGAAVSPGVGFFHKILGYLPLLLMLGSELSSKFMITSMKSSVGASSKNMPFYGNFSFEELGSFKKSLFNWLHKLSLGVIALALAGLAFTGTLMSFSFSKMGIIGEAHKVLYSAFLLSIFVCVSSDMLKNSVLVNRIKTTCNKDQLQNTIV